MANLKNKLSKFVAIGTIALGLTYCGNFAYYAVRGKYFEHQFYSTEIGKQTSENWSENWRKQIELSNERYEITSAFKKEFEKTYEHLPPSSIDALKKKLDTTQSKLQELKDRQKPLEEISKKITSSQKYKDFEKKRDYYVGRMFNPFYRAKTDK